MTEKTCKILVAEDDKFLSRAYEFKLRQLGCSHIILARDGDEALEKIRGEKPDLVLLDLIMPKKSGFDVLAEIKADPALKEIPVIIMSNLGQEADVKKGLEAGANDYVVKANTSLEDVVTRIKKLLGQKMGNAQKEQAKIPGGTAKISCPNCHEAVPENAKFCPNCGAKVRG